MMTLRRLDWRLRTVGAAIADWPEGERQEALLLLRHSAAARRLLADVLAAAEDEIRPEECPILARMQLRLGGALAKRRGASVGMRLGALAGCAMVGIWLGVAQAQDTGAFPHDPLQAWTNLPVDGLQP